MSQWSIPLPRAPLLFATWLVFGPILGVAVCLVTGESFREEIILATTGGLIGGSLYWLAGGADIVLTAICLLIGALQLILSYDVLAGLYRLEG